MTSRLPELVVADRQEIDGLRDRARRWWLGWLLSALMLAGSGALYVQQARLAARLTEVQAQQIAVTLQQDQVRAAQEQAWEQQEQAIQVVLAWAGYIRDRLSISAENGVALPEVPRRRALTHGTAAAKEKP